MTIQEIFELCIQTGIDNDPRGRQGIEKLLSKNKKEYSELTAKKKAEYDKDRLTNPYSDSAIHFGDPNKVIKRILIGIDIDSAEVLLAKELERMGKPIDLIVSHHPIGKALALLHEVMDIQTEVLVKAGMPENIAEGTLQERLAQVSRDVAPINHYQPIDTAKILNIPILNVHTPADNCVWHFVDQYIQDKKPQTVGEIIDCLKEIPEYNKAIKLQAGPVIFSGEEKSRAGKIVVSGMTGGTGGSEKVYERMSHYGIGTEIAMHIAEKSREEAAKHYINVVIAGHIASDSIGLNLIVDKLEKAGIEIIPCSGYIRHSREK
ncbi:MAG: glutamate synthase-related protein [bacterium]|nr:glutamate synthase-related protein [bacterium]